MKHQWNWVIRVISRQLLHCNVFQNFKRVRQVNVADQVAFFASVTSHDVEYLVKHAHFKHHFMNFGVMM